MDIQEIAARYRQLQLEEMETKPRWFWCSFCDSTLPPGSQFLGVVIVKAQGPATATALTYVLGINPGGEILFCELPYPLKPKDEFVNRLLTKAEAEGDDIFD